MGNVRRNYSSLATLMTLANILAFSPPHSTTVRNLVMIAIKVITFVGNNREKKSQFKYKHVYNKYICHHYVQS